MSRATIRARVDAATPGPWGVLRGQCYIVPEEQVDRPLGWASDPIVDAHRFAHPLAEAKEEPWGKGKLRTGRAAHPPDAAFIAAARTDVPLLLRVADAAEVVRALGHIEDDGPSQCQCKPHAALRDALRDLEAAP